jgi:hypothetical protein
VARKIDYEPTDGSVWGLVASGAMNLTVALGAKAADRIAGHIVGRPSGV